MATTKQCLFINYRRKALHIPGHIDRDQRAGVYVLVDGDKRIELGKRWRQAVQALETISGKTPRDAKRY